MTLRKGCENMNAVAGKIMSWNDIQRVFPNQWVGLKNVTWKNSATVDTAEVCFTEQDMSSDDMALMAIRGDIDTAKNTTPDEGDSVGALMRV